MVADTVPAFAQSLVKVRVSRLPIVPYVPMDLAMSRGWFKEAGLDVTVGAVTGGTVAMQALLGGKLDVIFTAFDAPIKARGQGFDVVIIANNNNAAHFAPDAGAILVRNDAGIRTLKDLEGKRVLVNNLQNVNWAYTRAAVAKAGGDPDKLHFLEVRFPNMVDALLGGHADAASLTEPFTTIGNSTGKLRVLTYMFVEVQPGLNIAGWAARKSWVNKHPAAVAAFRRTLQRAMDFLEQNPEEKTKAILKFTPLKAGLLSRITIDKWTTRIDRKDLEKQLALYKRHGMIDKVFGVNTLLVP
jgi:NitT/TauT family transport system substrate-binding protein